MDNYFTNFPLAARLLEKQTTLVGTLRSNKRDISPLAKSISDRTRGDSKHYYNGNNTICSYWDKSRKPVLLLSTMHGAQTNVIIEKPEMVSYYNSMKSGVDNLDKLVRCFRSTRKCTRWPYSIFFTLVDVAVVANFKLFNEDHYTFKRELGFEIVMRQINWRKTNSRLQETCKRAMRCVGVQIDEPMSPVNQQIRGRCAFCSRGVDRKTKDKCIQCTRFICGDHTAGKCPECQGTDCAYFYNCNLSIFAFADIFRIISSYKFVKSSFLHSLRVLIPG